MPYHLPAGSSSPADVRKGHSSAVHFLFKILLLLTASGSVGCVGSYTALSPATQQVIACRSIDNTGLVLSPNQAPAGTPGVTILVTDPLLSLSSPGSGVGFAKIATVLWNGSANGIAETRVDAFTIQ